MKFDVDYTRLFKFDDATLWPSMWDLAWPILTATVLFAFRKTAISRVALTRLGVGVYAELGPGSFKGTDGRIDFINQTGDMKLDLNLEYRTFLGWKLHGAVFVDAGNIWTLRNYADQPGGQFRFNTFYQQIAMAYGLGLRLNF